MAIPKGFILYWIWYGECRIRIEDLHEIDEMIGVLQEMRKQCENLTRWKHMPIN